MSKENVFKVSNTISRLKSAVKSLSSIKFKVSESKDNHYKTKPKRIIKSDKIIGKVFYINGRTHVYYNNQILPLTAKSASIAGCKVYYAETDNAEVTKIITDTKVTRYARVIGRHKYRRNQSLLGYITNDLEFEVIKKVKDDTEDIK